MTDQYVTYLRDSGEPGQETSTDQQYARENGYTITRTFHDREGIEERLLLPS